MTASNPQRALSIGLGDSSGAESVLIPMICRCTSASAANNSITLSADLDIFCPSVPGTTAARSGTRAFGSLRMPGAWRCPVARELEVLDLVFAHGNEVRAESEDVRGHQHRIGEQAEVGRNTAGDLVLIAVGALEIGYWHE